MTVAVTCDAGPTGFGLARFLATEGIGCLVEAPSSFPVNRTAPGDFAATGRFRDRPVDGEVVEVLGHTPLTDRSDHEEPAKHRPDEKH